MMYSQTHKSNNDLILAGDNLLVSVVISLLWDVSACVCVYALLTAYRLMQITFD